MTRRQLLNACLTTGVTTGMLAHRAEGSARWGGPVLDIHLHPGRQADVTDLNRWFWTRGLLTVTSLAADVGWCDAGTHETLAQSVAMVERAEAGSGRMVACPEEIAWEHGWISDAQVRQRLPDLDIGPYGEYLRRVLAKGRSGAAVVS